MPDEYNGTPRPEDHNPNSDGQEGADNIPEWMKEAGWEESSGTFDESKPVFDDLEDEDEIVPADIPAWLEEAAPEGFSFEEQSPSEPETDPSASEPDPFIGDDFDFGEPVESPPADEMDASEVSDQPPVPAEEEALDIPSWLENLELDEDSQETAVAWLENMPESLRATEEELLAAEEEFLARQQDDPQDADQIEQPEDELAWVDGISGAGEPGLSTEEQEQAALSEELVASDLIPESSDPDQIFAQDEIESIEGAIPSWMKELGSDQPDREEPPAPDREFSGEIEPEPSPADDRNMLPDWLLDMDDEDEFSAEEPEFPPEERRPEMSSPTVDDELPDWLGEVEDAEQPQSTAEAESLEWLDSLAADAAEPVVDTPPTIPVDQEPAEELDFEPSRPEDLPLARETEDQPAGEAVSPNDDTLNAQVPDWLANIDEVEGVPTEAEPAEDAETLEPEEISEKAGRGESQGDFEQDASWLDQLGEETLDQAGDGTLESDREVIDWLDAREEPEPGEEGPSLDELRDDLTDTDLSPEEPTELETAKYFQEEEPAPSEQPPVQETGPDIGEDLPDWLSELRAEEEEPRSLEDAIRQSDHALTEAEQEFLSRNEETRVESEDWLSKLDDLEEEAPQEIPEQPSYEDQLPTGGILDRLRGAEADEADQEEMDIPQWLEDLKTEEDPQETAVLWLQEFLNKGEEVNVQAEIQRYTDELDAGDSIPKWMEDLKNEEDPQTTAMLWLEKLSSDRPAQKPAQPQEPDDDHSDWLVELEREEAKQTEDKPSQGSEDELTDDADWLADLEIDQKLEDEEEELPQWAPVDETGSAEDEESEPAWMKATSPLEGEFFTDELSGEEEPEVPDWLAGYGEGEIPEEPQPADSSKADGGSSPAEDEYAWLSAADTPRKPRELLDLNKAAISQLESILGISYQVAKGIVMYREKQGGYRSFSDLMHVPEIVDEQTIEILKPEVFIGEPTREAQPAETEPEEADEPTSAEEQTKPERVKKTPEKETYPEILAAARSLFAESDLENALERYARLVKKKKLLDEVIEDLKKVTLDHPLNISVLKTLGDAYMQSDLLDEALEAYSRAEDLLA